MGTNERQIVEILTDVLGAVLAQRLMAGETVTDAEIAAARAEHHASLAELDDAIAERRAEPGS